MDILKILHTADLHFSQKQDKLEETIYCTDYILAQAELIQPSLSIVAGDTVDEYDGRINLDSPPARASIKFIKDLAMISPVVIVRGTISHDREAPYIFGQLDTKFPVHVSHDIEMICLLQNKTFEPYYGDPRSIAENRYHVPLKAVITLLPSPDKGKTLSGCINQDIMSANIEASDKMRDILTAIGEINKTVPENIPRILVAHGMITGSEFSSGIRATGEDFEYSVSDINLTNTDYKAFGHIHKMQKFPGNIFYSGSAGRMNLGETEEKGFLVPILMEREVTAVDFVSTPARKFSLHETKWETGGLEAITTEALKCASECDGADVRFRYSIPEEEAHTVDRKALITKFKEAGANSVKIESSIIPKVRQRAEGISQLETLPDKIRKWGATTGVEIPDRTIEISETIEGESVDELIESVKRSLSQKEETHGQECV